MTDTEFVIHAATRIGHVHLTVANLERQIDFYRRVVAVPDAGELRRPSDRLEQTELSIERNEAGVLVRDPSRNSVLLTDRA